MFQWDTIDGRYKAARQIVKLDSEGELEEAGVLRKLLDEAILVYNSPEYVVFRGRKSLFAVYGHSDMECLNDYIRENKTDFICRVKIGCTFLPGMICQQAEPVLLPGTRTEKFYAFEGRDGKPWFIGM